MEEAMDSTPVADGSQFYGHLKFRRPCILVAEDDIAMRTMVVWALKSQGFATVECSDGLSLMKHLGVSKPEDASHAFDLVISDVHMPGISGLQALEKVTRRPPLIVITAFGDAETYAAARRLGAIEVFDKPLDLNDLIAAVKATIPAARQHNRHPEAEAPAAGATPSFPCEIVLRHEASTEPIRGLVRSLAARLNHFSDLIEYCTVVIEESVSTGRGSPPYHVHVRLDTRNGTIIARGGAGDHDAHRSVYAAITSAFHNVTGQLKEEAERRRDQARKGAHFRRSH
jgi:CheY-like chemotaxis protein